MTDLPPNTAPPTPAEASAQRDALLRDDSFVTRWNAGDPAAIKQISALDTARVNGAADRPRPPRAGGTGLLTQAEARRLAQASFDAGGDPVALRAAIADTDPDWSPDARSKSERQYADDFEPGHPERYSGPTDRYFAGDAPHEQEALATVTRNFVASLGFDREGGSDLAETITRTMAERRGERSEARALYAQRQQARLGSKAAELIADAAKALAGVNPELTAFMQKSGALDSADVVVALAHLQQARVAHST